jgi:membrane AbrB-like protein
VVAGVTGSFTKRVSRQTISCALLTLACASGGGLAFDMLGMPAPYLGGAILPCALLALSGITQNVPRLLRDLALVVMGTVVGSSVDADLLATLPQWPVSVIALAIGMAAVVGVLPRYFTRVHRIDRPTARLCAIPGAVSLVMALADDMAVDTRRVAVLQSLRLVILLFLVPVFVGIGMDTGAFARDQSPVLSLHEIVVVLVAAALGGVVAARLRFPAPYLTGSILTTGLLFVSGVVSGQLPGPLIAAAFIVIGASIGARFSGIDRAYLASSLSAGLAGVVLAVGLTAAVALPAAMLAGAPFIQIWLAIAPGGFDTMIALSLALGVDPAFVAGHQLLRLAGLFFIVPFLFRDAAKSQREDRVADTAQQDDCE